MKTRASRLPLNLLCSASLVDDGIPIGAGEAADLGTACHRLLTDRIAGRNEMDVWEAAAFYRVDSDELAKLAAWGWKAWEAVSSHFVDPQVETSLEYSRDGFTLTGHADVLSLVGRELRLADFKTGYRDDDHTDQLKAYAFLALHMTDCDSAYMVAIGVRNRTADGIRMTRAELDDWFAGVLRRLDRPMEYRPGSHCRYCPRGLSCPAKTELIRQAAGALFAEDDPAGISLPVELSERGQVLADLLDHCRLIEDVSGAVRALIKADVAAHGGKLPTRDGRQLEIVEQKRREIQFPEAYPILSEVLGEQELRKLLKVSKGAVETAAKAGAPRGRKGLAVQQLLAELEQADALASKTIERLEIRRADGPVEPALGTGAYYTPLALLSKE